MALEVLAVRLATDNLTQAELQKAQGEMNEIKRLFENDDERAPELFLKVDRDFHKMVIKAADNQRLATNLEGLQAQIGVFQVYGIHLIPLVKLSVGHHQKILTALINRDRLGAEKAMENHIGEVKIEVLSKLVNHHELKEISTPS